MFKLRLLAGNLDRLGELLDTLGFEIETSRMDKYREERDDSPTDEMEVIPGDKDE